MSVGLLALFDDVAAIAKVAAASLDDVASQAARAGGKAAGVVIDDAAVTPRYVTGFSAARELPIIGKIALGSVKNKILILLPAALVLSLFAPQAITPLLMLGGAYLCYEGVEKIYSLVLPHPAQAHEAALEPIELDATSLEATKVASAIKTDFILSAEIMAIALAALSEETGIVAQAVILALVGVGITAMVYGGVALIVKADDAGLWLARRPSRNVAAAVARMVGFALVQAMPHLLAALSLAGTAAMIWVGGGIIVHGLERFGFAWPAHAIHDAGGAAASAVPAAGGLAGWIVEAAASGVVGLVVGFLAIPAMSYVISPVWRATKARLRRRRT